MSIGVTCIFDPAIFDSNIFTCCGAAPPSPAPSGGSADSGSDAKRRHQREEDELEHSNIERKRRYNEWFIAREQSKKLAKKLIKPVPEVNQTTKTLTIYNPELAEKAVKQVAQSVVYRIYQEEEKQKILEMMHKKALLEDEMEAILLLMGD